VNWVQSVPAVQSVQNVWNHWNFWNDWNQKTFVSTDPLPATGEACSSVVYGVNNPG
jgi:hypothetical protein